MGKCHLNVSGKNRDNLRVHFKFIQINITAEAKQKENNLITKREAKLKIATKCKKNQCFTRLMLYIVESFLIPSHLWKARKYIYQFRSWKNLLLFRKLRQKPKTSTSSLWLQLLIVKGAKTVKLQTETDSNKKSKMSSYPNIAPLPLKFLRPKTHSYRKTTPSLWWGLKCWDMWGSTTTSTTWWRVWLFSHWKVGIYMT